MRTRGVKRPYDRRVEFFSEAVILTAGGWLRASTSSTETGGKRTIHFGAADKKFRAEITHNGVGLVLAKDICRFEILTRSDPRRSSVPGGRYTLLLQEENPDA